MIIDIDSHWERSHYAEGDHPLEPWRDDLPGSLDLLRFAIGDDLLRCLPESERPTTKEFLPVLAARAQQTGESLHPHHDSSIAEREAWMDRIGIDHCIVNPGGYFEELAYLGPERRRAGSERCNSYLCEQLSESARLHPVAMLDLSDLDHAVAELERTRRLGARGFFLSTDHGRPVSGVSPGHPRWDRLWSAATSLGMMPIIHIGNTFRDFTGWADIGWNGPDGAGVAGLVRLANMNVDRVTMDLLSGLLFGGAFHRHPKLTVLIEEAHAGWLPWYVKSAGRMASPNPVLGDWPYPVSGAEMLERNVRLTPLPGLGDDDAIELLTAMPKMTVWSSDYPHQEGNAEPIALYGAALDEIDPELRSQFLGDNIASCFARMGDALPAA